MAACRSSGLGTVPTISMVAGDPRMGMRTVGTRGRDPREGSASKASERRACRATASSSRLRRRSYSLTMTPTAISSTTTRAATMKAPLPLVISGEGIGAGVGLTWAQAAVAVMQSAPAAASAARVPVIWQIRLMASTSWALKAASPMPWGESRRSYRSVGSLPWTDTTGPLSRAGRFFPLQVSFARLCSAGNLAGFAPPAPRLVVQRLRRSAQDGRRSCLVVVHGLERSQDELTLSLLERGAQRQEHGVRAFGLVGGHGAKRQALGRDQIALAGDDGPLDDVSKLADVARPRMLEKPGHGGVVDRFDLTLILLVELRD